MREREKRKMRKRKGNENEMKMKMKKRWGVKWKWVGSVLVFVSSSFAVHSCRPRSSGTGTCIFLCESSNLLVSLMYCSTDLMFLLSPSRLSPSSVFRPICFLRVRRCSLYAVQYLI
jgi:hypothetical protein